MAHSLVALDFSESQNHTLSEVKVSSQLLQLKLTWQAARTFWHVYGGGHWVGSEVQLCSDISNTGTTDRWKVQNLVACAAVRVFGVCHLGV